MHADCCPAEFSGRRRQSAANSVWMEKLRRTRPVSEILIADIALLAGVAAALALL